MREILFRGKKAYNSKWIEGYFYSGQNNDSYIIIHSKGYPSAKFIRVLPETVGQYTGLTDKNGTKIFEGDVVSGHLDDLFPEDETRYKVIWDDYGWHIRNSTGTDTFEQGWARQYFEVIGNIHDNPELLKNN